MFSVGTSRAEALKNGVAFILRGWAADAAEVPGHILPGFAKQFTKKQRKV